MSFKPKKVEKNVREFLTKCSNIVGSYEADWFDINSWCYLQENPVDSPIEQILYCAFGTLRRICCYEKDDVYGEPGKEYILGLGLHPQKKIGNYRVDFLASYHPRKDPKYSKEVIIECDSQQFHERTEEERRYEKMRDRFLQKDGYKIFRFTGSEIIKDPFIIAAEVISYLTGKPQEDLLDENYIDKEKA